MRDARKGRLFLAQELLLVLCRWNGNSKHHEGNETGARSPHVPAGPGALASQAHAFTPPLDTEHHLRDRGKRAQRARGHVAAV